MSATALRRTLLTVILVLLTVTAVSAAPAAPAAPARPAAATFFERLEDAARRWIRERLGLPRTAAPPAPKCGGGIDPNGCPKPCTSNCGG